MCTEKLKISISCSKMFQRRYRFCLVEFKINLPDNQSSYPVMHEVDNIEILIQFLIKMN